jgi:hypothetical protein
VNSAYRFSCVPASNGKAGAEFRQVGSSDFAVDGDVIMALAWKMKEHFLGAR